MLGRPKALEGALAAPATTVRGGHGCSVVTKLEREPSCGASARPHPCATCTRSPRQEGAAAALYSHVLAEVWASGLSDLVEVEAWHTPTSKLVQVEVSLVEVAWRLLKLGVWSERGCKWGAGDERDLRVWRGEGGEPGASRGCGTGREGTASERVRCEERE